jgi:hypothetical protein
MQEEEQAEKEKKEKHDAWLKKIKKPYKVDRYGHV